ncbi:rhoGAP domain-containing protein [Ditylenchus destructor]|nr:rhoGAP domain-containing protein [Ditylenchus destructor]
MFYKNSSELTIQHTKSLEQLPNKNGVPNFLIEAFEWLEERDFLKVEGIFRKQGNASRIANIWDLFCCLYRIPDECNVHDVCSLLKRFFREIRTPLFTENQTKMLNFAETFGETGKCKSLLKGAIFAVVERLPIAHIATISFLMKQLKRISEHAEDHQMSIDNLAMVFAPSLFRGEAFHTAFPSNNKKKTDKNYSRNDVMNSIRSRNDLQIFLVKFLIQSSNLIGVPELKTLRPPALPNRLSAGSSNEENWDLANRSINRDRSTDIPDDIKFNVDDGKKDAREKFNIDMRGFKVPKLPVIDETKEDIRTAIEPCLPDVILTSNDLCSDALKVETHKEPSVIASENEYCSPIKPDFTESASIVRRIRNSITAKDLQPPNMSSTASNRPSLAYFQMNNRGFVQNRVSQFGQLACHRTREGRAPK